MFDLPSVLHGLQHPALRRVAGAVADITIELPFDDPNLTSLPPRYLVMVFVGVTGLVLAALYFWKKKSGGSD